MNRLTLAAAYLATIVAANWAIGRWGVVPVGLGLTAPAGVYFAGLAFGLRDALQEVAGRAWVLVAIVVGSALSWIVADGVTLPGGTVPLAVASGVAFGLSELADLAVYTPLRDRNLPAAVAVSNLAGAVVDSALFLWLAFGTLDLLAGQVLGKMLMVVPALPVVWVLHARRPVPA